MATKGTKNTKEKRPATGPTLALPLLFFFVPYVFFVANFHFIPVWWQR